LHPPRFSNREGWVKQILRKSIPFLVTMSALFVMALPSMATPRAGHSESVNATARVALERTAPVVLAQGGRGRGGGRCSSFAKQNRCSVRWDNRSAQCVCIGR
jgi:hypothetical protein